MFSNYSFETGWIKLGELTGWSIIEVPFNNYSFETG